MARKDTPDQVTYKDLFCKSCQKITLHVLAQGGIFWWKYRCDKCGTLKTVKRSEVT